MSKVLDANSNSYKRRSVDQGVASRTWRGSRGFSPAISLHFFLLLLSPASVASKRDTACLRAVLPSSSRHRRVGTTSCSFGPHRVNRFLDRFRRRFGQAQHHGGFHGDAAASATRRFLHDSCSQSRAAWKRCDRQDWQYSAGSNSGQCSSETRPDDQCGGARCEDSERHDCARTQVSRNGWLRYP